MSRTQLEQLWECGDLTRVFGGDITTVPWPRAPKGALSRDGLDTLVGGLRGAAPTLIDVDPRTLWANQPSLVRHHAAYYVTGTWERTGTTSADMASALNRYPVIVSDRQGRLIIATGHHRSLTALIQGRPVRCRFVDARTKSRLVPEKEQLTITPLLRVGFSGIEDAEVAAMAVERSGPGGSAVTVDSETTAAAVLWRLGLDPDQTRDRIEMAASGRTIVDR